MSDFWKNKPLEKVIRHQIEYHQIKQERIKPNKRLEIQEANDQFFVTNETEALTAFWCYFSMGVGGVFFLIIVQYFGVGFVNMVTLWIGLPFVLLALFHLIIFFLVPIKEIILDRLHGKITYPRLFGKLNSSHKRNF